MYRSRFAFAIAMAGLAAILLPSSLTAQITFERTYGGARGDWGKAAQQTTDGGFVVAGWTWSFGAGGSDVYLAKTDSLGDTLWTRTYGGTGGDEGSSVRRTADGGYIIAGYTNSYGAGGCDFYLIKTDANGDTMWTRTVGGVMAELGYSVEQTSDSGYIVTGYTFSFGRGYNDIYLAKTNASGDTEWTRTYGDTRHDYGTSVQQTTDGGYVLCGTTYSRDSMGADVYLVRIDADGRTLWTQTIGDTSDDKGYAVRQTTDGGFVVTGTTCSFGTGYWDVYLIKTDAEGETLWTKTFGSTQEDCGESVEQTADGGYIIAGYTSSFGAGHADIYLIMTDANGDTLRTQTFGGTSNESGFSVQQTVDGGFIVAGVTDSYGAGFEDLYLIKTDPLGNVAVAEPKASPTRASDPTIACQPNPATGATTISLSPFAIGHSPFALRIYDAQGRVVRSFSLLSPPSSLTWDGRDDWDQMLPSGAYFVRLDAGSQHATTRLVLQR